MNSARGVRLSAGGAVAAVAACALFGCSGTRQERVELSLSLAGRDLSEPLRIPLRGDAVGQGAAGGDAGAGQSADAGAGLADAGGAPTGAEQSTASDAGPAVFNSLDAGALSDAVFDAGAPADAGVLPLDASAPVGGQGASPVAEENAEDEGIAEIRLERAELAFGPFYLCAGRQAGDLCETARLEWLGSSLVDVLDPEPQPAGVLAGVTGTVRSWMYDLGVTSLLTQQESVPLEAALGQGGVSLHLAGRARLSGVTVTFESSVTVQQSSETERGVPVVRSGEADTFSYEVTTADQGLTLRFDPEPWIRAVDWGYWVQGRGCAPQSSPGDVACNGLVEQLCGEEGAVSAERDCRAQGAVCEPGVGCVGQLRMEPDTRAYRAIFTALVARDRPTLEWAPRRP